MTAYQVNTIFYVDDDPDDRAFFEEVTEQIGEPISVFELGDDLLAQLKNPPPNPSVVFLDLNMPKKDGFEVLTEIKSSEAFRSIPVVILSTASDQETIERCIKKGASLFITKATSFNDLKKSIEHVISIDWQTHQTTPQNFVFKP